MEDAGKYNDPFASPSLAEMIYANYQARREADASWKKGLPTPHGWICEKNGKDVS